MPSYAPRNFTCPKCQINLRIIGEFKGCNHCGYAPPVKKRTSSNSKKEQPTRTTSARRTRCPHCLQSLRLVEVEMGQETDGRKGKYKCSNCLKWSDRFEFIETVEWTQSACCSYCQSRDGKFVDEVRRNLALGLGPSHITVTLFACRDCGVTGGISWLPEKPDDPLPASWTTPTGKPSLAKSEVVAQLLELSALWRSGALSDAEFEAAKKRVLGLG